MSDHLDAIRTQMFSMMGESKAQNIWIPKKLCHVNCMHEQMLVKQMMGFGT